MNLESSDYNQVFNTFLTHRGTESPCVLEKCHFTLYYPYKFVSLQPRKQFEYVERTVKHR